MTREVRPLSPAGVDLYDDKVRTRLAEIMAAAGVSHGQVSLEVLFFLPKAFVEAYEHMFTQAVKSDGGESARNIQQQQAGEVGKAAGKGAAGGKRYKKSFVVLDEAALALKSRMDKRLRMMARDIEDGLSGQVSRARTGQCGSCGMFLQVGWKFCPKDGTAQAID